MYKLIDDSAFSSLNLAQGHILHGHSLNAAFIEGAILAVNLSPRPIDLDICLQALIGKDIQSMGLSLEDLAARKASLITQFESQYQVLMRNEYQVLDYFSNDGELKDWAYGFLNLWQIVEEKWQSIQEINDGTLRMLQALVTTLMLAIDENSTQQQMREAGIDHPPAFQHMKPQLPIMINEVAMAADTLMLGHRSQSINPYKSVGRNDPCPCGSGKKFKQCCG